jgi:hypothetical protein
MGLRRVLPRGCHSNVGMYDDQGWLRALSLLL